MTTAAAIPAVNSAIGLSNSVSPSELFALTDEQILEIEPQHQVPSDSDAAAHVAPASLPAPRSSRHSVDESRLEAGATQSSIGTVESAEPPPWLAAQMKDPWTADEARELWNGVLQARQEAAAYREVFAKPEEARALREDARALKELYPGGVEQARASAERARTLEEIDAAFYGAAGKSPEQQSASRAALAQRMLHEDPAAFREMVFAGLRALESAGQSPHAPQSSAASTAPPNVVPGFSPASEQSTAAQTHPQAQNDTQVPAGARHVHRGPIGAVPVDAAAQNPHLVEYRAFEKSANDELERSVGGAINRALEQALPVAQPILAVRGDARTASHPQGTDKNAQPGLATLQQRLGGAIRADVESALKGDTQLGEQIAQLLSARRFDENTRAQVVRLINDRAQQLVPVAARRVIQDWTQTAFAAHRGRNETPVAQGESAPAPNGVAGSPAGFRSLDASTASSSGNTANSRAGSPSVSAKAAAADRAEKSADLSHRVTPRAPGRAVDYRKLSDEQILEM